MSVVRAGHNGVDGDGAAQSGQIADAPDRLDKALFGPRVPVMNLCAGAMKRDLHAAHTAIDELSRQSLVGEHPAIGAHDHPLLAPRSGPADPWHKRVVKRDLAPGQYDLRDVAGLGSANGGHHMFVRKNTFDPSMRHLTKTAGVVAT